ncbi:MAG TPA: glycosyltransferase, partial [bacterium]|nr:glycosyltransferase [bacterium]
LLLLALAHGAAYGIMRRRVSPRLQRLYEAGIIADSACFDAAFYRQARPDVAAAGLNPLLHYLAFGAREGVDPNPFFDSSYYLDAYPDVAAAGVNPLLHYLRWGWREQRQPSAAFDREFFTGNFPEALDDPHGPLNYLLKQYQSGFAGRSRSATLDDRVRRLLELWGASDHPPVPAAGGGAAPAPQASVIIPVYGKIHITLDCLQSLLRWGARVPYEIIVVNDASPDETGAVLGRLPFVRHLARQVNGGFIAACNAGAELARGESLVFLNNDTRVLPDWLDELIGTFHDRPSAGLVGAQLIYPDGRLQEAGCILWRDGSAWNWGRNGDRNHPQFNYARCVDYCSGAALAVPAALFRQLGGFDPAYQPAYYEDVDLAMKVRQAQREVVYQPLARVIHLEGATSGTDMTRSVKAYQVLNQQRFASRWREQLMAYGAAGVLPEQACDREAKRRVLFFDAAIPTPDQDAGSLEAVNWMKILTALNFRVSFIARDNLTYDKTYTAQLQRLGVECIHLPYVKSAETYVQEHGEKFDLIVAFRYVVALAVFQAARAFCPEVRTLFHVVDLHHLRMEREAQLSGSVKMRLEALAVRDDELKACTLSDVVCTPSKAEEDLLQEIFPERAVAMLPLCFEVPPRRCGFAERADVCFLGGYRHAPNVDAVEYFARDILPLLRQRIPQARFLIAGSNMPPSLRGMAGPNI